MTARNDLYYVKDGSEFQLRKKSNLPSFPDQILWFGQEVAILFDSENGTLLKHGDPGQVKAYVVKSRASAQAGGFPQLTLHWICLVSGQFSAEQLNAVLHRSQTVLALYKMVMEGLSLEPAKPLSST